MIKEEEFINFCNNKFNVDFSTNWQSILNVIKAENYYQVFQKEFDKIFNIFTKNKNINLLSFVNHKIEFDCECKDWLFLDITTKYFFIRIYPVLNKISYLLYDNDDESGIEVTEKNIDKIILELLKV